MLSIFVVFIRQNVLKIQEICPSGSWLSLQKLPSLSNLESAKQNKFQIHIIPLETFQFHIFHISGRFGCILTFEVYLEYRSEIVGMTTKFAEKLYRRLSTYL